MRTFTLDELVTLAKQRADQEDEGFISDAEWKSFLSSGYAVLHSELVSSGARYFEKETTYTQGSDSWRVPDDFLSCVGVDYLQDGTTTGRRYALQEFMIQERNLYSGVSGSGYAAGYALVGQNIDLAPTPSTGQVYALVYIPQPAKLTEGSTIIDVVTPDGEQYLLWYAVFLARDKEDTDVRSALREREAALLRLKEWAVNRSLHTPRRPMVDQLLGAYDDDPGGYRWGGRWGR